MSRYAITLDLETVSRLATMLTHPTGYSEEERASAARVVKSAVASCIVLPDIAQSDIDAVIAADAKRRAS